MIVSKYDNTTNLIITCDKIKCTCYFNTLNKGYIKITVS